MSGMWRQQDIQYEYEIHCLCDKVDHKQEFRFLYLLGPIVTWQYNPNPLD